MALLQSNRMPRLRELNLRDHCFDIDFARLIQARGGTLRVEA